MHAVNLISRALPESEAPIPPDSTGGVCCVTGDSTLTIPRKDALGPSFTDGALLRAPQSDRIGVDAARALGYKWERMSSWICDGKRFTRLDRQAVRAAVLGDAPSSPWCAYATTSYKKHGVLRSPVNSGTRRLWLHEMRVADCSDRAATLSMWERLNAALRSGIPRPVIETLDASTYCIRTVGISAWMEFDAWARPLFKGPLYGFLAYLLPSQEELKVEGHIKPAPTELGKRQESLF